MWYLTTVWQSTLLDILIQAAILGCVAGVAVGSIVYPVMEESGAAGRALLFGIIGAIIMILVEGARVGIQAGGSFQSLVTTVTAGGPILVEMGRNIGLGALVGMVIGVMSLVPNVALKGGILGLLLGAVTGAAFQYGLMYFGYGGLPRWAFFIVTGLLCWGLFTSLGR